MMVVQSNQRTQGKTLLSRSLLHVYMYTYVVLLHIILIVVDCRKTEHHIKTITIREVVAILIILLDIRQVHPYDTGMF